MIRGSTVTFGCIAFLVGIVLFRIKYEVVDLENRHVQIQKSIQSTKESIHLLNAEFAHLTDPARIQRLASKYLENGAALPEIVSVVREKKAAPLKVESANKNVQEKKAVAKPEIKPVAKKKSTSLDDLLDVVPQKITEKRGE